jgi:phosphoadenylyl-sulfate reductase (thioredoxin)
MTPAEIAAAADALEGRPPAEVLAWAAGRFAPRITFATGFGVEGCVLVDLIARGGLNVDLFTLDTGVFFPETYALWQRLEERYGVKVRAVRGEQPERLWETDPDRCCELRKVVPLRRELLGFDAWVSAIRRDQTGNRAAARVVEPDAKFGLVKVNPLSAWTSREVWNYVAANDVPYNPLHDAGYPSIGCAPCTTAVAPGEDPRAGRWRGRGKTECGIHAQSSVEDSGPSASGRLKGPAEPALLQPLVSLNRKGA